ncbi:MAG: PAS domain S-box protein [Candidatus Nealsonbacteria bacterium]|nr:PAS domain S-box protein [Candidatus Nealsonbacteria bacterium]
MSTYSAGKKTKKKSGTPKECREKISGLVEDLALLESYNNEFFSFFPLPVCFVNPNGVVLEANPAFEVVSGMTTYEIIGEQVEKFFGKEKTEELTQGTLKNGFVKGQEAKFFNKEQKGILVNVFTQVRRNPEKETTGYFVGFFDLTDTKAAEKNLKDTQAALLNMLEDVEETRRGAEEEKDKTLAVISNLADGILAFDRENRLSLINPQAEKSLRVKKEEVVHKNVLELKGFPNLGPLLDLVGDDIKGIFRKEIKIDENLVLEVSTAPMVSRGEKMGSLVILHDVTREKIIEKMKTEFVSLAAHQLRTPLSAIKWSLTMILEGDTGQITQEQKDMLDKTYKSNERMIDLINDLLDVTRIEEGRYLFKPILTQLEPIVEFVVNSSQDEAGRKKIKLGFRKPLKILPKVMVDVEKIRLAIQNFIDNALRYTPASGEITISLRAEKKEIEFSIRDTGVGIPEDQKARVFSKFFRASNVIRMETEGSGLGLFITKNIIEAHGGKVWFESKEGQGTNFYFTLPVKEEFAEFLKEF